MFKSNLGLTGDLSLRTLDPPRPRRARGLRLPGGRLFFTRDPGSSTLLSSEVFSTNVRLVARNAAGKITDIRECGSGTVTNIGVDIMANDYTFATAPVLKAMNYHAIGTGTTASAASDYYLQTAQGATNLSGTTNGYMTGTQSFVSPNIYQSVATFTFTGNVAVTEWGLFNSNAANFSGTATSTNGTSLTNTGASFTTSGNGLQAWAVEASSTAVNTPTTTAWGLIASNSATVLTIQSWLTLANASASTPSGTTSYVVYPGMFDHQEFSVLNMANGGTLQVTFQLTVNSGG